MLTRGSSRLRYYARNLVRVSVRFDVSEDLGDASVRIDDERRSHDAHVLSTEHLLFGPHTVCVRNGVIGIRQQSKGQPILCLEFLVRFHRVWTHADDCRIEPLEPREGVAKL